MFRLMAFFVLLPCSFWAEQPYVTCQLEGQLGNQLFEIAATLAYSWDHDVQPLFPELNRGDWNIPYNKERIFFRLDNAQLPRSPQYTYHHSYFNSDTIPYYSDLYLRGYFQHWKLFDHHREKLLEVFAPSDAVTAYLDTKYADIIRHPNTVAVHVRTQSAWVHYESGSFFVGLDYFQRAMELFSKDVLFVIFSDRINWCKHHLANPELNIVFIEGNDHIEDLFLMSKMKHFIISNSTLSWWGAYLSTNPHKTVVAPKYWFNPKKHPNLESVNLPDWTILDVHYEAPYPDDMKKYDAKSLSFDNQ